jgi:hypothetical protein
MQRKHLFVGLGVVCCAVILAGAISAAPGDGVSRIVAHVGGSPYGGTIPDELPPVIRGEGEIISHGEALSTIVYDDGSCESGLGLTGATFSSVVDFDVPTQCIQAGLEIVGLTAKINTNTANSFVFFQAGAAPGTGRGTVPGIGLFGTGPCPTAQTLQTAFVSGAVITGTQNFFAGVYGNMFVGRDTGVSAGRMWIRTNTTGSTYSPAYLAGLGFGGNWVMRVTVEDQNCVPVELQSITIE